MQPDPHFAKRSEQAVHGLCSELDASEIGEMMDLLSRHFDGVDPAIFLCDLGEKSHVLRVRKGRRLIGFSTLVVDHEQVNGETIHVLYSGDTIMDPEGWGSPVLARGWIRMVREVRSSLPSGRCFWLLLSAGFRTYRFLPVFWRKFWPRHDGPEPRPVRELMDGLALRRFGNLYDRAAGVVRFEHPHRLREALAEVSAGRGADPHIAFFLARNPGWRSGDELVCLTEIDDENLTDAGRRMIRPMES